MEQPAGVPLASFRQALGRHEALSILIALGHAVDALHSAGWLHTEIAPSSIFIDLPGRRCRLVHFDFALRFGQGVPPSKSVDGRSSEYLAPEVPRSGFTRASEIYSLGSIMYRLLTGADPVSGPDPLPHLNGLDADLRRVIAKAVSAAPATRYRSVTTLLKSLCTSSGWKVAKATRRTTDTDEAAVAMPDSLDDGRIKVGPALAMGAQGMIFRGTIAQQHNDLPEIPVLIKCIRYLRASELTDVAARVREIREARAQLEHEANMYQRLHRFTGSVPQVVDFFRGESHDLMIRNQFAEGRWNEPYLVLKDLGSSDLESFGCPPEDFTFRTVARLSSALDVIHKRGIVYKDLKPQNVLSDRYGVMVHLVDFGAACPVITRDSTRGPGGAPTGSLDTQSPGYLNMTPGYQGPEFDDLQEATDYRFDVYSLGATLFRMLTGICPLRDLANAALASLSAEDEQSGAARAAARSLAERPVIPVEQAPVRHRTTLQHLLERDRERRVSSAEEAADALVVAERVLHGRLVGSPLVTGWACSSTGVTVDVTVPLDPAVVAVVLSRVHETGATVVGTAQLADDWRVRLVDSSPPGGRLRYRVHSTARLPLDEQPFEWEVRNTAPPVVTATGEPRQVRLSWTALAGATGFEVRRSLRSAPRDRSEGDLVGVHTTRPGARSYTDSGLSPGVTVHYAVFALYDDVSSRAGVARAVVQHPPLPPSVVQPDLSDSKQSHVVVWSQSCRFSPSFVVQELTQAETVAEEKLVPAPDRCARGHLVGDLASVCACGEQLVARHLSDLAPGELRRVRVMAAVTTQTSRFLSDPVEVTVLRHAGVDDLVGAGAVGHARLTWTSLPTVQRYTVQRVGPDGRPVEVSDTARGSFVEEGLPGPTRYVVQAWARAVDGSWLPMGSAEATCIVLRSVLSPSVGYRLGNDVLSVFWEWPVDTQLDRVSGVRVVCSVRGERIRDEVRGRETPPRLKLRLPIGARVEVTARGVYDGYESEPGLSAVLVATRPPLSVDVAVHLGTATIAWAVCEDAIGCVIRRWDAQSQKTVEVARLSGWSGSTEDGPPVETPIRYEVSALFADDVESVPFVTAAVEVPPMPPAPGALTVVPGRRSVRVSWTAAPGAERTTGWMVWAVAADSDAASSPPTTVVASVCEASIGRLKPWTPVRVTVRPLVGNEIGIHAARSIGWAFDDLLVAVSEDIGQVRFSWQSPGPGTLEISRSTPGIAGRTVLGCPLTAERMADSDPPLDVRSSYRLHAIVNHPIAGEMRGPETGPFVAFPRSAPPTLDPPEVHIDRAGRDLAVQWPPYTAADGVDLVEHVYSQTPPPAAGETRSAAEVDSYLQRADVTILSPTSAGKHRLADHGATFYLFRIVRNQVLGRFSHAAQGVGTPVHSLTAATHAGLWVELEAEKTSHLQVITRRRAGSSTGGRAGSGKEHLPGSVDAVMFSGSSALDALAAIQSRLLVGEGACLLDAGQTRTVDPWPAAATPDSEYRLHALVRGVGQRDAWYLGPAEAVGGLAPPSTYAVCAVVPRRRWLRRGMAVSYWTVGRGAGAPSTLTWTSSSGASGKVTARSEVSSTWIPCATGGETVEFRVDVTGESVPLVRADGLFVPGTVVDRDLVALWRARQWWAANRVTVLRALGSILPAGGETGARLAPCLERPEVARVPVGDAHGGGSLYFVPAVREGRAIIIVRRRLWYWFAATVAEVSCDAEPWLRLDGDAWRKVVGNVCRVLTGPGSPS